MTLEERNKLVEDNIPLARFMAWKYRWMVRDMEIADVLSLAYLALIKAADGYDPSQSQFSTYASRCIVHEIAEVVRSNGRQMRSAFGTCSLDAVLQGTDEVQVIDSIIIPGFEDETVERLWMDKILETLKPKERESVKRYFYYGYSTVDQAKADGITRSGAAQRINKAIKKLRCEVAV